MPTFIKRFRRSLPNTFPEWVCSIVILAIGLLWLIFPMSFSRVDMTQFVELMSPRHWTTFSIMIGMFSIIGLTSYIQSPKIGSMFRLVSGMGRVAIFGAFLGRSFADSEPGISYAIGVILFTGFIIFDIQNVSRASIDTFNAVRKVSYLVPSRR